VHDNAETREQRAGKRSVLLTKITSPIKTNSLNGKITKAAIRLKSE